MSAPFRRVMVEYEPVMGGRWLFVDADGGSPTECGRIEARDIGEGLTLHVDDDSGGPRRYEQEGDRDRHHRRRRYELYYHGRFCAAAGGDDLSVSISPPPRIPAMFRI